MSGSAAPVPNRTLITLSVMLGNLMQSLDASIANVSLPYMQGSLSTTADEITWVLTSYVIAAAIMTAPVGWMAHRFGRRNLHVTCMAGFVLASMLCGMAANLEEMVCFRFLQGMFGAALVPLSQATMLDIYPFEKRPQVMAIFGMGVMVGPIIGPTLGGYLTEIFSWRAVFYVNVPFGIVAVTGLLMFLPRVLPRSDLRFDWIGFGVLATAVAAFQLMLDRGQGQDWFNSPEIIAEAVLAALGLYLFVVHMFTAKAPFLPPGLFRDRNFVCGVSMVFCTATVMLASSALMAPYLENLAGYPVEQAGLAMAPRGVGTIIGMQLASRIAGRVDHRKVMAFGLLVMGVSLYSMSYWTPDVDRATIMLTLLVQGSSIGFVFNPMTVMAFTTLPANLRSYSTSLQSLCRSLGQALGVSVTSVMFVRNIQVSHADIAAGITPFNRVLQGQDAIQSAWGPASRHGVMLLDQVVNHQAQIIAFNNDYRLLSLVVIPPLFLLLLMRAHVVRAPTPATTPAPPPVAAPARAAATAD
ncbi:MAG: DHA2 family efflux MFS transporter permease subunit [Acetobacteraceae bacterium]|nr:DHA2 family efflux MFS transporter permease subunit [Acetobacteraceae bacterium]